MAGSNYNRVLFAQNLEDGPIIVDRDMRGGLRISNGGTDDKLTDIPEILMENGMMVFNNADSNYETDSITFTKKTSTTTNPQSPAIQPQENWLTKLSSGKN